jgi:hypothetical protein
MWMCKRERATERERERERVREGGSERESSVRHISAAGLLQGAGEEGGD